MKNDKNTKMHPEVFKMFNSTTYRRKVKRMVETAKTLRNISWGTKLPPRRKLGEKATQSQREAFAKLDRFALDKDTIHYFAQTNDARFDRRDNDNRDAKE
jgi:hypothetical protein